MHPVSLFHNVFDEKFPFPLQVSSEPGKQYNVSLINALVLFVGTQAITYIHSKSGTPSTSAIAHTAHMDIFQHLVVDLDTEGSLEGNV